MGESLPSSRTDRIRAILDDCLEKWYVLSEPEMEARFGDLLPELGEEMDRLRRVMQVAPDSVARRSTDGSLGDRSTAPSTRRSTGPPDPHGPSLPCVCPQCQTEWSIDLADPFPASQCGHCHRPWDWDVGSRTVEQLPPLGQLSHFAFLGRLGAGTFGTVWLARDLRLDRSVAIKIPRMVHRGGASWGLSVREAKIAARLNHPGIVSLYDVWDAGHGPWLISAYVPGQRLQDWRSQQNPSWQLVVQLGISVAEALQYAHGLGIVHRDLKPANILVDAQSIPHITDFGLAKFSGFMTTLSSAGIPLGTPAYMSPEQARGDGPQTDQRSDIYSLGVILFELLTSQLPFQGESWQILEQVFHHAPPPIRTFNRSIPRSLQKLVDQSLRKDPQERPTSAGEVAVRLQGARRESGVTGWTKGWEQGWPWRRTQ